MSEVCCPCAHSPPSASYVNQEEDESSSSISFALAPQFTPRHSHTEKQLLSQGSSIPNRQRLLSQCASSYTSGAATLLDLPDELFFHITSYLSSFTLLRLAAHSPSSSFNRQIKKINVFQLDLDKDINRQEYEACTQQQQQHSPYKHSSSRSLTQSKEQYKPFLSLVSQFSPLSVLTLNAFGQMIDDAQIQPMLNQHASSLISLSLSGNTLIAPYIDGPMLTHLDLSKNRALVSPVFVCPSLLELDLSRTFINDFDLQKCCPDLPYLRVLKLQSCKNIRSLPLSFPHLQLLDLSNTAIVDEAISRIALSTPTLSILILNECAVLRVPVLTSATLTVLSCRGCEQLRAATLHCPLLQQIDLSNTCLTDDAVVSLLATVPAVTTLSLGQCYALNSPQLLMDLPTLTCLDLSMSPINTAGLHSFFSHAVNLQTCRAVQCTKVIEHVLPTLLCLPPLTHLHEMNLRSTNITDADVVQILLHCPFVTSLNLSNCVNVTGAFHSSVTSATLIKLDMSLCPIDDTTMAHLFNPYLAAVRIAYFNNCDSLQHPVITAPQLTELSLSFCRSLSTLTLDCPNLIEFDISSAMSLSSVSGTALSAGLRVVHARHLSHYLLRLLEHQFSHDHQHVEMKSHQLNQGAALPFAATHASQHTHRRVASTLLTPPSSIGSTEPAAGERSLSQRRQQIVQRRHRSTGVSPSTSPLSVSSLSSSPLSASISPSNHTTVNAQLLAASPSSAAVSVPVSPAPLVAALSPSSSSSSSSTPTSSSSSSSSSGSFQPNRHIRSAPRAIERRREQRRSEHHPHIVMTTAAGTAGAVAENASI